MGSMSVLRVGSRLADASTPEKHDGAIGGRKADNEVSDAHKIREKRRGEKERKDKVMYSCAI